MGGDGQSIFLLIVVLAVVFCVAAWLIHLIFRIRKTQRVYRSIMEKRQEDAFGNKTTEEPVSKEILEGNTEGNKPS